MTVLPPSADLSFDGAVPQREETIRYDVHDRNLARLGTLMVDRGHPPTITNDSTRPVRRTLSTLNIPPRPMVDTDPTHFYAEDIDPLSMRVRPWWVLSTGEQYPLGIFVWGDDSEVVWSWGEPRAATLTDETADLDQPLDRAYGVTTGILLSDVLRDLAVAAGIPEERLAITDSTSTVSVPIGWAPGRDTFLRAMESACATLGYLPPYFSNSGMLTCRPSRYVLTDDADFTYGSGTVVIPGTIVRSSDILTAPNRYVVVSTTTNSAEIVGTYDIPDEAPNSAFNRGRVIRKTIDLQGIESQDAADQAAAVAYVSDSATYSWLAFDTPPDPRHDTFDIISFDGTRYRQLSWTLECKAGGKMSHSARGYWQ